MKKWAYYNENDSFAAAWCRELMNDGLIAPGEVDERSIEDVCPQDVKDFTQCHFFSGISVWSLSLRLAGWPDDRPVWTGSCPCQPFSAAGKGDGFDDERHLWPAWFHLITHGKRRDVPVLGEQVASKDGRAWFDLVSSDMQGLDHACGAVDTSAASLGAPFIGQRLYWLAATHSARLEGHGRSGQLDATAGRQVATGHSAATGSLRGVAASDSEQHDGSGESGETGWFESSNHRTAHRPAASDSERRSFDPQLREETTGRDISDFAETTRNEQVSSAPHQRSENGDGIPLHPVDYWRDADWLLCRDPNGPRFRPVESATQRMAYDRTLGRIVVDSSGARETHFPLCEAKECVNRLNEVRGFGNALNVSQATCFIEAVMDYLDQ